MAGDYFKVGSNAPMIEAFSSWVEKGYQILSSKKQPPGGLCSWRFWARGPKGNTLVCGLGRDSSDSVGRPYPLLIAGTGPVAGWVDEWDMLPFACEKTWRQMESLSARRFVDFEQFEDEVQIIRPPIAEWAALRSENWSPGGSSSATNGDLLQGDRVDMESRVTDLSENKEFFVSLDRGPTDRSQTDPQALTGSWHSLLKNSNGEAPNAVFMGGTSRGTYLAVFRRALAPADFVLLWSGIGGALEVEGKDPGGAVGGHRLEV